MATDQAVLRDQEHVQAGDEEDEEDEETAGQEPVGVAGRRGGGVGFGDGATRP